MTKTHSAPPIWKEFHPVRDMIIGALKNNPAAEMTLLKLSSPGHGGIAATKILKEDWERFVKIGGILEEESPDSIEPVEFLLSPLVPYENRSDPDSFNSDFIDGFDIGVGANFITNRFSDHTFVFDKPYSYEELQALNLETATHYVNIDSVYNTGFGTDWEKFIKDPEISELVLPNFYVLLHELRRTDNGVGGLLTFDSGEEDFGSPNTPNIFDFIVSLGGTLDPNIPTPIVNIPKNSDALPQKYFNHWMAGFPIFLQGVPTGVALTFQAMHNFHKNIGIPVDDLPVIQNYNDKTDHFPFYNMIEFKTDSTNALADQIEKSRLSKTIMRKIMQEHSSPIFDPLGPNFRWTPKPFVEFAQRKVRYQNPGGSGGELNYYHSFQRSNRKILNFKRFLTQIAETPNLLISGGTAAIDGEQVEIDGIFHGDLDRFCIFPSGASIEPDFFGPWEKFVKHMLILYLKSKIDKITKQRTRTFKEIWDGKTCYSETIIYRIEKLKKKNIAGAITFDPIQNFYIPNSSKIDIAKFIDTQVKYGKDATYKYKLYAYEAVFGNTYQYIWPGNECDYTVGADYVNQQNSLSVNAVRPAGSDYDVKEFVAHVGVLSVPSVQIIETCAYISPEIKTLDKPPIRPDVDLIPYKGVDDKLLVHFNAGVGKVKEEYISILPELDDEKISAIKSAQLIKPNPGGIGIFDTTDPSQDALDTMPVEFESDDQIAYYEVFRIGQIPESYQDFKLHTTVVATSFVDNIKPNTKYYYTFRSVDNHGHFSNPTVVYEVEMVNDSGAIRPYIRAHHMEDLMEKKVVCKKSAQRYVQILPTYKQLEKILRPALADNDLEDLFIGEADQNKNPKKFKIRITSKKTGKRIDLNVKFKKNVTTLEEGAGTSQDDVGL